MLKLDILYQFNEKYAPFAGTSMTSLFDNNRHFDEIRVFILGEGLSEDTCCRLRQLAADYGRTLSLVATDELLCMMKKMNMPTYRGSYAANMRLFLSYVLPEDVTRLLYLDADTIVDGPIDSLATLDMEGHPVAMVLDSLVRIHKKRLGFAKDDFYYNSGVMLFSMDDWRSSRCSERIVNHVKNVRAWYPSPDQDLINVVLKGEILKLEPEYNMQPIHLAFFLKDYLRVFGARGYYSYEELQIAKYRPIIYHFFRFVGEFPWDRDNLHPDNDIFEKYLRMSPWYDYIKKPSRSSLLLRIEKMLYSKLPAAVFIRIFRFAYERFIRKANDDSLKMKTNQNM